MRWLNDPNIFNYIIMFLQMAAAGRHLADRNFAQAIYWTAGTVLVATVTWGMK